MQRLIRYLTGLALAAATALETGWPQSASREPHLSDIMAQQPQETIVASAPCQRAMETPRGLIYQSNVIDPKTFAPDLKTLMDMSDEVILAAMLDGRTVISPSGNSVTTYLDVKEVRSWKGPHHPGDILTFGMPVGMISCEPTGRTDGVRFLVLADKIREPVTGPYVFVLFLRQSQGDETQSVQGLRLAAAEGLQGVFEIEVPPMTHDEPVKDCNGNRWTWQRCDSYMETSQSPVKAHYPSDPLGKKYNGMPASDFLREVQSVAAAMKFSK